MRLFLFRLWLHGKFESHPILFSIQIIEQNYLLIQRRENFKSCFWVDEIMLPVFPR